MAIKEDKRGVNTPGRGTMKHENGAGAVGRPARAAIFRGEEHVPFYPDQVRREAIVAYVVLLAVILMAVLSPPHLGPRADPMETPAHVKPEWYFLSLYQVLKLVPRDVGILIPLVAVAVLILLPFLDHSKETDRRQRQWRLVAALVLTTVVIAFTVWGYVS